MDRYACLLEERRRVFHPIFCGAKNIAGASLVMGYNEMTHELFLKGTGGLIFVIDRLPVDAMYRQFVCDRLNIYLDACNDIMHLRKTYNVHWYSDPWHPRCSSTYFTKLPLELMDLVYGFYYNEHDRHVRCKSCGCWTDIGDYDDRIHRIQPGMLGCRHDYCSGCIQDMLFNMELDRIEISGALVACGQCRTKEPSYALGYGDMIKRRCLFCWADIYYYMLGKRIERAENSYLNPENYEYYDESESLDNEDR